MTETTATTGTSIDKVDTELSDDHAPSGGAHRPEGAGKQDGAHGSQEPEAQDGSHAVGRAAVRSESEPAGDSSKPADSSTASESTGALHVASDLITLPSGGPSPPERPTFTRAPGMPPPPVHLDDGDGSDSTQRAPAGVGVPTGGIRVTASGAYPVISGTAPVSAPPRGAGRPGTSGITMRPISPDAAVGAARVSDVVHANRNASTPRGPRRARLGVKRIDPWSVMKFSFAVSLVLFIVMIVAASVLYLALDTMGVFASINNTLADLVESGGGEGEATFQITARGVIGTATVLGAINVVLFTALATLGAFVYNVCADLVGGVEVTLAERD